jgi:hypothetical protein
MIRHTFIDILNVKNKKGRHLELMNPEHVIDKIIEANKWLAEFWSNAYGWALEETADLISAARLDRQVSLSMALKLWVRNSETDLSDGELILAWSNLGSLIEGTLKLFCSVFYEDYLQDVNAFKKRDGEIIDSDILCLEQLKVIFHKSACFGKEWFKYISFVQQRRNAIHAYQDKDIGNTKEFYKCVEKYLYLIDKVHRRIPYPDEIYVPRFIERT